MTELTTIIPASRRTMLLLGEGRDSAEPLIWSSFLIRRPTDEGLLLFNTLTLELLHVPAELVPALEAPTGALRETLRKKWFLVPPELDQHAAARELLQALKLMELPADWLKKYTVFPTTACNGRCFYCFERGWEPRTMSLETADRLADYMLAHSGKHRFQIDWFGGEPTVNLRVIDRICARLNDAGADFHSHMVSNGLLFDAELIDRAVKLWRMDEIQITLDGVGETYERIKNYRVGGEGAFRRVTDNIEALAAAGIQVTVRMNFDLHNLEQIEELADWMIERYAGIRGIVAYPAPLFEDPDDPSVWHTDEERDRICAAELRLRAKMEAAGLRHVLPLPREHQTHMCMADSGCMVTVLPDGELGLCQNYNRSNFIGSIDREGFDEAECARMLELREEIPACADCPIYPDCIRVKLCPTQICYPQRRRVKEENKKTSMLSEWIRYQQRRNSK